MTQTTIDKGMLHYDPLYCRLTGNEKPVPLIKRHILLEDFMA